MPKVMKSLAPISSLSALAGAILYRFAVLPWLLSPAITLGTIAYHLDYARVLFPAGIFPGGGGTGDVSGGNRP